MSMCDVMPTILEEGGGDAEIACGETNSYSGSAESLDGAYSLDKTEFNNPFIAYAKLDGDGGTGTNEASDTSPPLLENSSNSPFDADAVAACAPPAPAPHSGRNLEQLMLSMLEERDRLLETLRDTQEKLSLLEHRLSDAEKERDLLQKQFEAGVPQVRVRRLIIQLL